MERAELARRLGGHPGATPARTVIAESDPVRFRRAFAEAVAGTGEVFLTDPAWKEAERAQLAELLNAPAGDATAHGWLMIPTGGSSGKIKFARHDQDTMAAAVGGFTRHFGLTPVNAVGLLPLHHVSGLMAWMRCVLTGGVYQTADWKTVEAGVWPELPATPAGWVLSLVPTQLERLLRSAEGVQPLRAYRCIFLGGAPAWPELLAQAAAAGLPLSTGYGMTETAAMAAALRPEEFLAGKRGCGSALPHAVVRLEADGRIVLAGDSVLRGYYPGWNDRREFATEDVGELDAAGCLTVLGRRDGVIITGGEKVRPEEVEAVLRDTGQFADVAVLGLPDAEWGQRVVAAYPAGVPPDWPAVAAALDQALAGYKRPKEFVALAIWPRRGQGKINRPELAALVVAARAAGS